MSNIFLDIGLFVTVLGLGIVVYVIARYRDMELTEDPGGLQFSSLKNIPGEDFVDLNVVKVGKTRTLGSYHGSGSIKWEAFFNPSTSEDMERRKPAAVALVAAYGVFAVMAAVRARRNIWPLGDDLGLMTRVIRRLQKERRWHARITRRLISG